MILISIHALLAESDSCLLISALWMAHFYPRSPCGERLSIVSFRRDNNTNFYPRSPCGERPPLASGTKTISTISIHALLAESDNFKSQKRTGKVNFYPRSPCGERQFSRLLTHHQSGFLSTLSLRRATLMTCKCRPAYQKFLSTLSLRRATEAQDGYKDTVTISIHALLAESDGESNCAYLPGCISIHALLAESDRLKTPCVKLSIISIHALLAESDFFLFMVYSMFVYFYPRSPCGERLC